MTRYCAISIAAAQDWDSEFPLDDYCKKKEKADILEILRKTLEF